MTAGLLTHQMNSGAVRLDPPPSKARIREWACRGGGRCTMAAIWHIMYGQTWQASAVQ